MEWYGVLAFAFILFVFVGIVWVGANTDKLGEYGFGKPSAISEGSTSQVPNLSSSGFSLFNFGSSVLDADKIKRDLEERISRAQSYQEIEIIIQDFAKELLDNPRAEAECKQIAIDYKKEVDKMTAWSESGKDIYNFPVERLQELGKLFQICAPGYQQGWYEPLDPSFLN